MRSPHCPRAVGEAIASRSACADCDSAWVTSAWLRSDWSTCPNRWALCSASAGDHRAELLELGAHLDAHLVEPRVDDVLLGAELGHRLLPRLLGDGAELLAVEHGGLLERGVHCGIAFASGLGAQFDERQRDRVAHRLVGGLTRRQPPPAGGA